jgi:Putative collagen-binding domain of a collagenase
MWDQSRYALNFFKNSTIPFWTMSNMNSLVANRGWCLTSSDNLWNVVYLKSGGTTSINLVGQAGDVFIVKWYDPRHGGPLQDGTVKSVAVGNNQGIGTAPNNGSLDWAILVLHESLMVAGPVPPAPVAVSTKMPVQAPTPIVPSTGTCGLPWNGPDLSIGSAGFTHTYVIDTSCVDAVTISVTIRHTGSVDSIGAYMDTLKVFYKIGNSPEVLWLEIFGRQYTNLPQVTVDTPGSDISIRIEGFTSDELEFYEIQSFQVIPITNSIIGFALVNVNDAASKVAITDGAVINMADAGGGPFNVQALTAGAIGSVKFGYGSNPSFRTENVPPFALCGDSDGAYFVCLAMTAGGNKITATAYSGGDATGLVLGTSTVTFTLE